MEKVLVKVLGIDSNKIPHGVIVWLAEENGSGKMPIVIDFPEAQAIAVHLENMPLPRPKTHDLFLPIADGFGFVLDEVLIYELKEGIFFAKLLFSKGYKTITIEARPSDAIPIALRMGAPVFVSNRVWMEAAQLPQTSNKATRDETEPSQEDKKTETKKDIPITKRTSSAAPAAPSDPKALFVEQAKSFSLEKLNELLDEAINNEEYEKAALLRDILSKRG